MKTCPILFECSKGALVVYNGEFAVIGDKQGIINALLEDARDERNPLEMRETAQNWATAVFIYC